MNTSTLIAPPAVVRRAEAQDTHAIQALDSAHFIHPFTDHGDLATRGARVITRAEGIYVWDSEGHQILDAMSGLWCVNAGYGRKELADAAYQQLMTLPFYNSFFQTTNVPAVQLAAKLASLAPTVGDRSFKHVFFSSSGSESNDTNVRMARRYWDLMGQPERKVIISRHNAYHGSTMAGASLGGMSGMHAQGDLPIPNITHIEQPHAWDHALPGESRADFGVRAAGWLEEQILAIGPEKVAAFIGEPVQGAGGVIIPPLGWLERVRDLCDELDVLMIADEVITGFGRTGKWFAVEHEGVVPDLMSVAKGITSGYIPLSASIAREKIADVFGENSTDENVHPNTYCGHPVACAAGLANLEILAREGLIENSARMGERLHRALEQRIGGLPIVGEVRSRGLLLAVDFVDPHRAGQSLAGNLVGSLNMKGWQRGVIPFARGSVLRLAQPLCIDAAQVDELADLMCGIVEELQDEVTRAAKDRVAV